MSWGLLDSNAASHLVLFSLQFFSNTFFCKYLSTLVNNK